MKTLATILILMILVILTGCATPGRNDGYSLIDPRGVDMNRYNTDYYECSALANQTSVGANAVAGVGIGAVVGAIIGSVVCGRDCANQGAAFGAGYGGVSGAAGGVREQQTTLRACLAGRGYSLIR